MSNTDTCPAEDILRDYLRGATDPHQCEQIESHLTHCESCEETLLSFEGDTDTMIRHLRAAATDSMVSSSVDPEMRRALRESRKQIENPVSGFSKVRQAWTPPMESIGRYRLHHSIGSGGMGAVYLATHEDLGKQFAIKLLPLSPADHGQRQERFLREIRAAGSLDHASIVTATDAGCHDEIHFLAMEYIDGFDLSRVAAGGRLSIADACEIIQQVAQGLSYAHAKGVVHRDIKPSNLMLRRDGEIKILDFGLAQMSAWDGEYAELTSVGQLMGTLDYMSPEQAEQPTAVDYRADLYSLGATLFRLIAGRPPLAAAPNLSPLAKLRLLANHSAPRLNSVREDVPEQLVLLVDSLLSPKPEDRPASASHVAETLASFTPGSDLAALATAVATRPSTAITDESNSGMTRSWTLGDDSETSTDQPPSTLWRWLCLALVPLLALAAIVIHLETQKGQLVIESNVPDVTVELVKDGKSVDHLEIKPGSNSTRLKAGRYQVVIAKGTDSVALDKESIRIRSGEITVARVIPPAPTKTYPILPSSSQPLQPGQRLQLSSVTDKILDMELTVLADYTIKPRQIGVINIRGKTLSEVESLLNAEYAKWYADPGVELFVKFDGVVGSAPNDLVGLSHLPMVTPESSEAVEPRTLEPVYDEKPLSHWLNVIRTEREHDRLVLAMNAVLALGSEEQADEIVTALRESYHRISSGLVTIALRKAVPDKQMPKFLMEQIAEGDQEWAAMLLVHCDSLLENPADQETIARWILDHVFVDDGDNALHSSSVDFCLRFVQRPRIDTSLRNRVIDALRKVSLGKDRLIHPFYWLGKAGYRDENSEWMQNLIYDVGREIVVDDSSDPNLVSAALAALVDQRKSHIEMASVAQNDQGLVDAMIRRLQNTKRTEWSNRRPEKMDHLFNFSIDSLHRRNRNVAFRSVSFNIDSGILHVDPVFQLLAFVDATSIADDAVAQLDRLIAETKAGYERTDRFIKTSRVNLLELNWQTMEPMSIKWESPKGPAGKIESEDLPTAQDWFDSYVYMNALALRQSLPNRNE